MNGIPITYCWSHGITSNLRHNSKYLKLQKEGHRSNTTYQNHMGGSTERCKFRNKLIGGSMTSSNKNAVKAIKLPLLQKHVMSAPPSINLKIDSGATHHFHEIGSTDLPKQPTFNYNPASRVILPNGASMVSSTNPHLPIPSLPPSATKSHGFNHLASGSLFFFGQV